MSELPVNPYAPPASNIDATAATAAGVEGGAFAGRLFSTRQMGVAAFLGSACAGVLLLQANYRAMGKPAAANKALLLGLLAGASQIVVAMLLPDRIPSTPLNIAACLVFYKIGDSLQGKDINRHLAAGGARGSNWRVLGAVLVFVAVVFVGVVAWQFVHSAPGAGAP